MSFTFCNQSNIFSQILLIAFYLTLSLNQTGGQYFSQSMSIHSRWVVVTYELGRTRTFFSKKVDRAVKSENDFCNQSTLFRFFKKSSSCHFYYFQIYFQKRLIQNEIKLRTNVLILISARYLFKASLKAFSNRILTKPFHEYF